MYQNVKKNIEYQIELIEGFGLLKLYTCPVSFCIIEVIICIIIKSYIPLTFLITTNVPIFLTLIITVSSGYQKKNIILSGALFFTYTSIVFCILSFLILSSLRGISIWYIFFELVLYLVLSIMNILHTSKRIKNTKIKSNMEYKKGSSALGILGGVIGVLIARTLLAVLGYQSTVLVFAMLSLFVSLICSVGAQLYFYYYLLKKEANNKMDS